MEPFGRIGIGVLELISAILILIPRTIWRGTLLTEGLMSGVIAMYLPQLGIAINYDGNHLYHMVLVMFSLSLIIVINQQKNSSFLATKI